MDNEVDDILEDDAEEGPWLLEFDVDTRLRNQQLDAIFQISRWPSTFRKIFIEDTSAAQRESEVHLERKNFDADTRSQSSGPCAPTMGTSCVVDRFVS